MTRGITPRPMSSKLLPLVYVVATAATLFLVGVLVYVVASFWLMRPHATRRHAQLSFRAMVREAILAILSQPFLPIFYLVGRRMDRLVLLGAERGLANLAEERRAPTGGATNPAEPLVEEIVGTGPAPIVLVHGYMQNRVGFVGLARALAVRGLGPIFGFNYPWFSSIDRNAARLARFVDEVCEETGSSEVDLVCHSMGGLVAIEMMRQRAKSPHEALRVRRCVTIATPHAGIAWRGPILGIGATNLRRGSALLEEHAGAVLGVPCLSVYSTHDNIVHPKETSSLGTRGGKDQEVEGEGHLAILFSRAVADHVVAFLRERDLRSSPVVPG